MQIFIKLLLRRYVLHKSFYVDHSLANPRHVESIIRPRYDSTSCYSEEGWRTINPCKNIAQNCWHIVQTYAVTSAISLCKWRHSNKLYHSETSPSVGRASGFIVVGKCGNDKLRTWQMIIEVSSLSSYINEINRRSPVTSTDLMMTFHPC